ncbi:MAG TPA: metal-dependent transcriptional regulator [Actinobacteria bacterium]|nr:metal-dependent transcriptional regulator [Actinomycetota bacterium]
MNNSNSLSPSLEDYLEIMLDIQDSKKIIKVSDVANRLKISKASVTQAITKLKKLGLANQESYSPVTLTHAGIEAAKKIRDKHKILKKFLTEILDIDNKIAEKDACLMEHILSITTINKISELIEKAEELNDNNYVGKVNISTRDKEIIDTIKIKRLDELKKGSKGTIIKIGNKSTVKKRFAEMGIVNNSNIEILGTAPLGDPMEVLIKGYKLTLRKSEASDIFVREENK